MAVLARAAERFDAQLLACYLMGNHYQSRFNSILVDRHTYLLELCRYVELNPVRAGMDGSPGEWPWSSYLAHVDSAGSPE